MHKTHDKNWPLIFSGWVQGVLDDERSNAFYIFVRSETRRLFHDTVAALQFGVVAALHDPAV